MLEYVLICQHNNNRTHTEICPLMDMSRTLLQRHINIAQKLAKEAKMGRRWE